ncbi:hypothetical protein HLV40_00230 [Chromohalobacter salexigens]|uniref:Uncharacterized protein n=3 Tax=Chromohalobacter TaxID=42054 RepID=A0A1Q8TAV1_9GAMM|nr:MULTISPECIES: hypothetical protein [Chromohalobacter]NWO08856.1 hypothetical protein [Chromohalobacter salexigens]CDQ36567.1 hypothetical protein BN993_06075 [Virgibacillus halodenitrificans]MCK0769204.1 hypothetical protein [Chromohalobacter canadensis]MCK2043709.1 hypothetical protein [Chromohalobacter moromii]MCK2046607.1 hypothetical protein [Chromohalobacter moromii]
MNGKLETFDDAGQRGVIVGDDGYRYTFTLTEWRGRGLPREGSRLRFDGDAGRAEQVFDAPVPQRTARQTRDAQGQVKSSLLSPWAVLALVLVATAPLLASYMLLVDALAVLLAVLGIRQVRRSPSRYRGQALCGAAIAIAVLSLFIWGVG